MCYVEHRMGYCRGAMLSIWRISRLQNPGTTFLLLNTRGYWDAEMQKVESTERQKSSGTCRILACFILVSINFFMHLRYNHSTLKSFDEQPCRQTSHMQLCVSSVKGKKCILQKVPCGIQEDIIVAWKYVDNGLKCSPPYMLMLLNNFIDNQANRLSHSCFIVRNDRRRFFDLIRT